MQDIFDEIIQCIRNENNPGGTVYVRKENLLEFYRNSSAAPQTAQPVQHPAARESMPQAERIRREFPPHSDSSPGSVYTKPDKVQISGFDWNTLKQAVAACRGCRLCEARKNTVFSDGTEHASLMFIGEGPGADEDQQGVPFVGKAGQLLTKMIAAMQFSRQEVYIANIVKCRPPGNREPEPDEMATCIPYLERQIELVSPKVIVLLGNVALKGLMNRSGISRMRGHWLDYKGIRVMPTFHPAYLLRYEEGKRDAWKDLQMVMSIFGKSIPKKQER